GRGRTPRGQRPRHAPDRSNLRYLRVTPGACVPGWTRSNRRALLHQLCLTRFRETIKRLRWKTAALSNRKPSLSEGFYFAKDPLGVRKSRLFWGHVSHGGSPSDHAPIERGSPPG